MGQEAHGLIDMASDSGDLRALRAVASSAWRRESNCRIKLSFGVEKQATWNFGGTGLYAFTGLPPSQSNPQSKPLLSPHPLTTPPRHHIYHLPHRAPRRACNVIPETDDSRNRPT